MRIALIGAGRMGGPILDRLIGAGYHVTVLLRRPEKEFPSSSEGLESSTSLPETVSKADVVICAVLSDAQVRSVCLGRDGAIAAMKPGAALIQHTTCDPGTLRLIEEEARARDVRVLDAALSGGPHDIALGRLTLWVAGDAKDLDELRPVLQTYASPIQFVGPLGNGQRIKLVNNALFVAHLALAVDAVRLTGELGLDESEALTALQMGSGASRALNVLGSSGSVDALAGGIERLMAKDMTSFRQAALSEGVELGLIGDVLSSKIVEEMILTRSATTPSA